ncbi:hypothetical protein ABIE09_004247 [Lysobacter enzymogenes]|uniref:hypothetical protein n=1 Tax=Lysobacter enzymogenes TaxID=69 RepID=UPI003396DD85
MDVEVLDVEVGAASATQEIHFSGGLRGALTNFGWALFPVSGDKESDALVFKTPQAHFEFATRQCGLRFLGTCVRYTTGDRLPPMDIWEFEARDPQSGLGAADSWGAIGDQATKAGDARYAELASYVSVALKAAALRLRDVSNGYHDQLIWALEEKRAPGRWFSNTALDDLYVDFHSLVSELSSARDHVATIAAMHAGAPDRIESLARLEDWAGKSVNSDAAKNPMVRTLMDALGTKIAPGWLRVMGDVRNEMLHRVPMSANRSVAGLVLERIDTALGDVSKIRLAEPLSEAPLSAQPPDPLVNISQFAMQLESLCRALWKHAKYPPELLVFRGAE